jgi:tetratricopeptide (TPR) repeat protein
LSAPAWEDEYAALLRAYFSAGDRDEEVRALEAAARLADHHSDLVRAYEARELLISAASFGGQPDRALVAFAWCRAQSRKDPERFSERSLLWSNKWIIGALPGHLGVTRDQILAAQDDFAEALLRQGGGGVRAVAKLRLLTALSMGELDEASRCYAAWMDTPRDAYSDCAACDADTEVDAQLTLGRYAEAIERAAPILSGRLACAEVPHITYSFVTLAFFRLGRLEDAKGTFLRGYRLTKANRNHLASMGRYLAFLGLTGNDGPALTLLERHLGWALDARARLDALTFFVSARFVLSQIAASGEQALALRLPRHFPLFRDDGLYDPGALLAWFDAQATDLAARFDARNGNDHHTGVLDRSRGWAADVRPFPITRGLG